MPPFRRQKLAEMVAIAEAVYEQELAKCSKTVSCAMMAIADSLSAYEEGKRIAALHTADEAHEIRPTQDARKSFPAALAVDFAQRLRVMERLVSALD